MLPSLLARDIQNGLKQFLLTGFEPSDDFFHGLMQRFVDEESAWMKGPYLQVGLPFRIGASGRKFFGHFETPERHYSTAGRFLALHRHGRHPASTPIHVGGGA